MPRVHSFDSCWINIYPKDHMPPHFHVLASDGREWLVRIDNGEVLELECWHSDLMPIDPDRFRVAY